MTAIPVTLNLRPPIYAQPREKFLYLYVTNRCGLRCRHCYVGNDRLDDSAEFTVELAEQVLDYFQITGGHDKLYILGGEPTLHPRLAEIVRDAIAATRSPSAATATSTTPCSTCSRRTCSHH